MSDTTLSFWDGVRRWFASTPRRTFVLFPLAVVVFEFAFRGQLTIVPWGVLFLIGGYALYRFAGNYRIARGKGGPGIDVPPEDLVTSGPYQYTRNPMYLGHLIFMLGLTITFVSWLAAALFLFHIYWFHRRVREDEERLTARFGKPYTAYTAKVKRWVPFVF
jgi:protein-S-isoprenylcysteine O-methyltransferase Ste14